MPPKRSFNDVKLQVESLGFELNTTSEEYTNVSNISVICKCGSIWKTELYSLVRGRLCNICASKRRVSSRKKIKFTNIELFLQNLNYKLLNNKSDFLGEPDPSLIICFKCDKNHEDKLPLVAFNNKCDEYNKNQIPYFCVKCCSNSKRTQQIKLQLEFNNDKSLIDLSKFYINGKIAIANKEYTELKKQEHIVESILQLLTKFDEPIMPIITENRMITSCKSLEKDTTQIANNEVITNCSGRTFLNYYIYPLLITTAKNNRKTYEEMWYDLEYRKKLVERSVKYDVIFNNGSLFGCYGCKYGRLYNFPPNVVKALYNHFNAKNILDFCAGYAGRLMGFYFSNADSYIGVDPNRQIPYNAIITNLQNMYNKNKEITIINDCAEDVDYMKLGTFDFIFTSPPYFNIEIYSKEDTQSCIRYPVFENWLEQFLFKTLRKVTYVLQVNGHLCINIKNPKHHEIVKPMIKFIKNLGLHEKDHIKFLHPKRYKNNKYEYIYVFQKLI